MEMRWGRILTQVLLSYLFIYYPIYLFVYLLSIYYPIYLFIIILFIHLLFNLLSYAYLNKI